MVTSCDFVALNSTLDDKLCLLLSATSVVSAQSSVPGSTEIGSIGEFEPFTQAVDM